MLPEVPKCTACGARLSQVEIEKWRTGGLWRLAGPFSRTCDRCRWRTFGAAQDKANEREHSETPANDGEHRG